MNKRKILTMALAVCMIAILAVGGSLAYLVDTDTKTNVFTVGDVTIDLWEDFDITDEDGTAKDGIAELHPVTYDKDGNRKPDNVAEKRVYVTNTGSEDAFVRVHIAIPALLDDGDPTFDASANILHFNYSEESVAAGKWDWSKAVDDGKTTGDWNFYTTTIEGIDYNVYVVTYTTVLKADDVTVDAIEQVYLDAGVTNADVTRLNTALGTQWKIWVIAEGCQAEGFDDAYEALNTAFGAPGSYTIDWTATTINTAEDKTLAEN